MPRSIAGGLLLVFALSAAIGGQQLRQPPTDPAHAALNQGPKEEATGAKAMVSTQLASSTLAAVKVLEAGGNAVDAAIAAAFLQQVDDYHMVFLFGSMSALYFDAATNRTYAISAVGERTYGSVPDAFGHDVSSFGPEDLSIGWRSGGAPSRAR